MSLYLSARSAVRRAALTVACLAIAAVARPAVAQTPDASVWVAPERAAHRPNPVALSAPAVQKGHMIFHRDCELCHGPKGHGDGPMSYSLPLKPADLASARVQSQPDGAIFWKMYEGRGVMPSTQSTLSDEERWSVIDYLRSLAKAN